jgi:hypothetical protein
VYGIHRAQRSELEQLLVAVTTTCVQQKWVIACCCKPCWQVIQLHCQHNKFVLVWASTA